MTHTHSEPPADDLRSYFEEPEAWEQVSKGLQRIAMAIVGNERDAEDVVQGAWLEALKKPEHRQSQGWIRRLVRFRALDVLRRRRQEPEDLADAEPVEDDADSADMRWKLDAQRQVLDAVNSLKEPYLSTVMLRYFEGKGPKEIALHLGVPERTVKTRLTRAHGMLRERLAERYRDRFGNWAQALVLFSVSGGWKPSSSLGPVASLTIMKKAMFAVAVLAVALLIPSAIQSFGGSPDEEAVSASASPQSVLPDPLAELTVPEAERREVMAEGEQEPKDQATFEYAFPPKLASEVGSLGIQVRWADGSPADHVKIGIMPEDAADAFLMGRTVYTDYNGFVKVDQLAPGRVSVFYSRIGVDKVQITAGQYSQIEKQASNGTPLSGLVRGPEGRPVAGALIYVADSRGGDSLPEPTAVADARGRYEIKNLYDRSYVSARAPGFSPSIPIETGVSTGQPTELNLTLRGKPATLRGLVLSPTGLPVVGAKIRIGLPPAFEESEGNSSRGGRRGSPLAFLLRTDDEGRFESDQVGSGAMKVMARAATWQPWVGNTELAVGEVVEITIHFERGVQLMGRVLQKNEQPIPEALVFSGRNATFDSYRVKTDAEGRFLINGLSPGAVELKVFHKEFEELITQTPLRSGIVNQVDFTLHKLQSVRGVVLDEAGAPLSRWLVAIETRIGLWSASAWTDSQGKFELKGIPDGSTDLMVTNEDYWTSATRLELESVLPAQGPLRIVVPDSVNPKSSIRMRVLVDGEPAPLETQIRLRSASPLTHRDVHPSADGSLVLDALASREFHLEVALPGYARFNKSFRLGVAEHLDLGTIHIEKGGQVHVRMAGTQASSAWTCHVLDERGRVLMSFDLKNGEGTSDPLPKGKVVLRLSSAEGATQFAETMIEAGENTEISFSARPGVYRKLLITRRDSLPLRFLTLAKVTGMKSQVHFYTEDLVRLHGAAGTVSIELPGLDLGSYRIHVRDPGGKVHESWLRVTTLDKAAESAMPILLDW